MYKDMANSLEKFGGHLECSVCHRKEPLSSIEDKLRTGWPVCCGYTMTWITAKQEVRNED